MSFVSQKRGEPGLFSPHRHMNNDGRCMPRLHFPLPAIHNRKSHQGHELKLLGFVPYRPYISLLMSCSITSKNSEVTYNFLCEPGGTMLATYLKRILEFAFPAALYIVGQSPRRLGFFCSVSGEACGST